MKHVCLIAAKGHSKRWPGKNLAMLPALLESLPSWIDAVMVGTDCTEIHSLAKRHKCLVHWRMFASDTEPVADVWRSMARSLCSINSPEYAYCPLANCSGLTNDDYMRARMLLRSVEQVKSYAMDGTESGLFACRMSVLLDAQPIAAYTGSITTTTAKEYHYASEQA